MLTPYTMHKISWSKVAPNVRLSFGPERCQQMHNKSLNLVISYGIPKLAVKKAGDGHATESRGQPLHETVNLGRVDSPEEQVISN